MTSSPQVVTLTANPSLDRTLSVPGPLERGAVVRLGPSSTEPGGKGVNVARAVAAAGVDVVCVLPAADDDPIVRALHELGMALATVPVAAAVRTNYTLTEPDGTTTKLNEPGTPLDEGARAALADTLHRHSAAARWVALSGSLPPDAPVDWYATLVASLRDTGARVAVDTSEGPLLALLAAGPGAAPDLLKPNSEELAQLAGMSEDEVLASPAATLAAVRSLHDRGVAEVLLTLGGDGALLSTAEGTAEGSVWSARPPRITVRSTVGAGDSSLAGYLLAALAGAPPAERLRTAVAYGSAAAALPGSALPSPASVDVSAVSVAAGPPDRIPHIPGPSTASTSTTSASTTDTSPAPHPDPVAGRIVP